MESLIDLPHNALEALPQALPKLLLQSVHLLPALLLLLLEVRLENSVELCRVNESLTLEQMPGSWLVGPGVVGSLRFKISAWWLGLHLLLQM